MNINKFMIRVLLLIFSISVVSQSLSAEKVHKITITVKGLSCPFCAYGIEKKIKKIEGLKILGIKMRTGKVNVSISEGNPLDLNLLSKTVKDAGFTPSEFILTANGYIGMNKAGKPVFKVNGSSDSFILNSNDENRERILSIAGQNNVKVILKGVVKKPSKNITHIFVLEVKKALL